nr:uncharacterized protein LOC100197382 [Hydra vulgaris]
MPHFTSIHAELDLWELFWENQSSIPSTVAGTLKSIDMRGFLNIRTAFIILGTIPITTCECERSISVIRRLKTFSRSNMIESRFNSLALMSIHQEIFPDVERVIDIFSKSEISKMSRSGGPTLGNITLHSRNGGLTLGKMTLEDNFCTFCGNKKKVKEEEEVNIRINEKFALSDFQKYKTVERKSRFKRKSFAPIISNDSLKKSRSIENVTINVGIMKDNGKDEINIVRGSKLPIHVPRQGNAKMVFEIACGKHADHNQFFDYNDNWVLLYPDKKKAEYVPGTNSLFTVEKYKESLNKPFSKIDLYLCKQSILNLENKEVADLNNDSSISDLDNFCFQYHSEDFNNNTLSNNYLGDFPEKLSIENNQSFSYFGVVDSKSVKNFKDISSQQTASQSSSGVSCGLCPVCNQRFPFSVLEQHADNCLKNKEKQIVYLIDSDDSIDLTNSYEKEQDFDKPENINDLKKKIPVLIKQLSDIHDGDVRINVRRQFEFEDFHKFFTKSWNKDKIHNLYKFSFVGEPAIDTGGVSREFYSEALKSIKIRFFTGDDLVGYVPSCGILSVADGTVKTIGHLFAASMVNGGPAPFFLSP